MEWFIKFNLNMLLLVFAYELLFRFNRNRQRSRYLLLLLPIVAACLPFVNLMYTGSALNISFTLPDYTISPQENSQSYEWSWLPYVSWIYAGGLVIVLLNQLRAFIQLFSKEHQTAFSFFNYCYIPANIDSESKEWMRLHEQAHQQLGHSYDVVFFTLLKMGCWFNPVVYRLFHLLKQEHEYAADAMTIQQMNDQQAYCELLLKTELGTISHQSIVHTFHTKQLLLNRIKMIIQTPIQSIPVWKKIAAAMLLCCVLCLSATTLLAQVKKPKSTEAVTDGASLPTFPGGNERLNNYLLQELKYPAKCKEQKIEGRVVVKFLVSETGQIQNVENLKKGMDPLLVNEAIRVVKAMPNWSPAQKDGKPVSAEMVLPIVFKL